MLGFDHSEKNCRQEIVARRGTVEALAGGTVANVVSV